MYSFDALLNATGYAGWAKSVVEIAVDFVVQSTLIIAAGLLLGRLIAKHTAVVRSAVYRAALVGVLVCPLVTFGQTLLGIRGWSFRPQEYWIWGEAGRNPVLQTTRVPENASEFERGSAPNHKFESIASDEFDQYAELILEEQLESTTIDSAERQSPRQATNAAGESLFFNASLGQLEFYAPFVIVAWIVVSTLMLVRIARGLISVAWLCRHATEADQATVSLSNELAIQMRVSPPSVLRSPFMSSPCLVGICCPKIVLPESIVRSALRSVIIHELAHLKRVDLWWKLLCELCTAVFFFQPLLWLLSRRIEAAAEDVCDDFVLRYGADRQEYARQLVEIAELALPTAPMCAGVVSMKSTLACRVMRILDAARLPVIQVSKSYRCAILFSSLILIVTVASIGLKPLVADSKASENAIQQVTPQRERPKFDRFGDTLPTGAELRMGTIRFRSEGVDSLAFSPDGKQLIAATNYDSSVLTWDIDSGREVKRLDLGTGILSAVLTPDGTRVIVRRPESVSLLELPGGEQVFSNDSLKRGHTDFVLSTDGSVLLSCADGMELAISDASTGIGLLDLATDRVDTMQLSPNGRFIAMAKSANGSIDIFDLHAGNVKVELNSNERVRWDAVAFPDDDSVVACGYTWATVGNKQIQKSRIEHWSLERPTTSTLFEHPEGELLGGSRNMILSHDRTCMVTAHDKRIVVWDLQSHRPLQTIPILATTASRLAMSRDNRRLAYLGLQCKATIWNLETKREEQPQSDSHHDRVLAIATLPKSGHVVSASRDGTTRLWSANTGNFLRTLDRNEGWTEDVEVFADGRHVALCGSNLGTSAIQGRIAIVEAETGRLVRQWTIDRSPKSLGISPSQNLLAVGISQQSKDPFVRGDANSQIQIWDLGQQQIAAQLQGSFGKIVEIEFTSESELRFTTDVGAFNWNLNHSEPKEIERINPTSIANRYSLRGQQLLAVSHVLDKGTQATTCTTRLINCSDKKVIWSRTAAGENVKLVEVSPDGRLAAAFKYEWKKPKLVILRLDTGEAMVTFDLGVLQAHTLAFSQDGRTLFTGMGQGDILSWDVSLAHNALRENVP